MSPRKRNQEHWFHRWKRPWRKPWRKEPTYSAVMLTRGGRGKAVPVPDWSFPPGIELVHDPSPALWVEESLAKYPWATVGGLVPDRFDAYARILHPAYRRLPDRQGEPITWAEVASTTGKTMHPLAQFGAIAGLGDDWNARLDWAEHPDEGDLPEEVAGPMLRVLANFTDEADDCWLCVWNGYGDFYALEGYDEESYRHVKTPGREYLLLSGALEMVSLVGTTGGGDPSIWWPDDRAWFVATEIDLDCTYVGASAECIARLMDEIALEVFPASLEDRVDFGSDTIN